MRCGDMSVWTKVVILFKTSDIKALIGLKINMKTWQTTAQPCLPIGLWLWMRVWWTPVVCRLFKQFEASCIVLLGSMTVNPPSSAAIVFKQSVHFLCDCVAKLVFAACFLNCFVFRGSDKCRVKPLEYCPVWKSVFCVVCRTYFWAVKERSLHWVLGLWLTDHINYTGCVFFYFAGSYQE